MQPVIKIDESSYPYDLICYCDGVSKNNPGDAGIGVVLYNKNKEIIKEVNEYIGKATNNIAEYSALIRAVREALKIKSKNIIVFSDSELMVKQVNGEYKTKDIALKSLRDEVRNLIKNFHKFTLVHIPREKNKLADKLANLSVKYL